MKYLDVLMRRYGSAEWVMRGDDYSGLEWLDASEKPSQAILDGLIDEVAVEVEWDDVRRIRDNRLAASDWTQVADAPVDSAAWSAYRQQLRDIPQDYATPDEVVWPTPPA